MRIGFALVGIGLLVSSLSARAETIDVETRRPAAANDVYMLRSLSVDRFAGTDGRALASAIERELSRLRDASGDPAFEMFATGAGQGAVSGRADVDVEDGRYTEKRRFCPGSRDPKAKCDDEVKETVEVNCRSRIVSLSADVRIVRERDGRVLLNRDVAQQAEARWCPGDANPPEIQAAVAELIRRAAGDATAGFAPSSQLQPIRIREDRRGLDKDVAAQFKAAVLATRGDGRDGCAKFEALNAVAPTHGPLIFNLALCAEARGDYVHAIDGYRHLGDRDAIAAADRVRATEDAIAQARARSPR